MAAEDSRALSKSFWAFSIVQFINALTDNVFRWLLAMVLMARAGFGEDGSLDVAPLFWVCFLWIVPHVFLSPLAGALADGQSKRNHLVRLQLLGIVPSILYVLAFLTEGTFLAYVALLFLMVRAALHQLVHGITAACDHGIRHLEFQDIDLGG